MNLPDKYIDEMKKILGDEYDLYEKSLSEESYSGIRINTLKTEPDEFINKGFKVISKIPWTENGYYYDSKVQVSKNPYYFGGLYYIQEPSAMTPASFMPVEKGDKVLDLCGAPGGKSTELGAKLKGSGVLVSNDISNTRAKALLKNIEMFGITNAIVTSEEPDKLARYFPEYFDKILVDAPCSGEGMFRKDSSMIKNWEKSGPEYYSKIQREIITLAAKMLKPGGYLMYSTCTFSPIENEDTIMYFLENNKEFELTDLPHINGFESGRKDLAYINSSELEKCIRIWPYKIKGEGHFIALLRKKEGAAELLKERECNNKKLPECIYDFLKDIRIEYDEKYFEIQSNRLYYMPKDIPDIKGLRILRSGWYLGEIKNDRFNPSQALASGLKKNQYKRCISFSNNDERVLKYLKCETIDINEEYENGYNLICVDDYPLGWGKLNKNVLKNKYYPGWRLM